MKILGIDYGTRRVGFAIGEIGSPLVLPIRSALITSMTEAVEATLAVINEQGAEEVVVGMPSPLSGSGSSPMVKEVTIFMAKLRENIDVPLFMEDERMTSAMVQRMRQAAGVHKDDFDVDAAAAAAILESYLARKK